MTATEVDLVQKLMFEFVNEMIANGPESPKLDTMLHDNRANAEFLRLAGIARRMKRSLRGPAGSVRERLAAAGK